MMLLIKYIEVSSYFHLWYIQAVPTFIFFNIYGCTQETKYDKIFFCVFFPICICILGIFRDLFIGLLSKIFLVDFYLNMKISLSLSYIIPPLLLIYTIFRRKTYILNIILIIFHCMYFSIGIFYGLFDFNLRIVGNKCVILIGALIFLYCHIEIIEKIVNRDRFYPFKVNILNIES